MMAAAIAGAEILDRGRVRAGAESEPIRLLLADAGYLSEHNLTARPGPTDRDHETTTVRGSGPPGRGGRSKV